MKKVIRWVWYTMLGVLGLVLLVVVFLFVYYQVLAGRKHKQDQVIAARMEHVTIPGDSTGGTPAGTTLNLIPVPQEVRFTGGTCRVPAALVYTVTDSLRQPVQEFLTMFPGMAGRFSTAGANISFRYRGDLPVQGYTLDIRSGRITVEYSTRQGLYYALVSLKVLKQNYEDVVPCVSIRDFPDLGVRGVMLDISRDKVPTLETLTGIVQLLADLKYNHFELYVEGFSFAYPSFKNLWEGKETPVTGEEIEKLDAFCRARFIDLVPNQNSLGHMMAWLTTDQYKDLAECPKGYKLMGLINMKSTLDPVDPRSLELVTAMTRDLLPCFTSPYFNMNLDEPFELGKGKSKELCEEKGVGEVYFDYVMKMHKLAATNKRSMLMWGDIAIRHPEILPRLPKDITLLDWGYEANYPYEKNCQMLRSAGVRYMVCPGTNSWTSITGRTDNMMATIAKAATNGVKYQAAGLLNTDWGDLGHWQYLPVSYAGYVTGAACSWNSRSAGTAPVSSFLSHYVFRDGSGIMGNVVLDLGRYSLFEEIPMPNMTSTMITLQFGMRDEVLQQAIFDKVIRGITDLMREMSPELVSTFQEQYRNRHAFDFAGAYKFLDDQEALLEQADLGTGDSLIIRDEYRNAIRLVKLGINLQQYTDNRRNMTREEEKAQLRTMRELGKQYLGENRRLWLLRNKPGGYERSTAALNTLMKQVDDRLNLLDKSNLVKELSRFLEAVTNAGAVLYLKAS
jgi:hexosaminidase